MKKTCSVPDFSYLILAVALLGGCEREQRQFQIPAAASSSMKPLGTNNERNAYALSQGKTLFRWFNCNGCHAAGGGGMGPALMDDKWLYGSSPQDIYNTIMEGRPNGMPSFRARISEEQAWQLAAYVRSMSGLARKDAAPGRSDSLYPGEPESVRDKR
jgi:cytochrome c oxidase cbb3-type subunit 3